MAKPAKWDSMTPSEQEAWREKNQKACRKWYAANREKVRKSSRKWQAANPGKKREFDRKYREANLDKRRKNASRYREANLEKVREYNRKRMIKSRQKTLQQTAADQFFIFAGAAESISKLKLKSE